MVSGRIIRAVSLCGGLLVPAVGGAQTVGGGPAASAASPSPGILGPSRPVPRPNGRVRAVKPDATLPDARMRSLPKPTAAERAEKRKLDHDLNICIGC